MEEAPCCSCGAWGFGYSKLDASLLSPDVLRRHVSGMLSEKFVCPDCLKRCDKCSAKMLKAQARWKGWLCKNCYKPPKRKPSGPIDKLVKACRK